MLRKAMLSREEIKDTYNHRRKTNVNINYQSNDPNRYFATKYPISKLAVVDIP